MRDYSNYKITSTFEFNPSFHIIPDISLFVGAGSLSIYFHFLNLAFYISIYWNLSGWYENKFELFTPSFTITKYYNADSTYLYHFDICWHTLLYRKSFWQINELNDKYPYDKKYYDSIQNQMSIEEFKSKIDRLKEETEKIFFKEDDNSD